MFREYLNKKWSVIPLIKNDKRPAIKWEEFQKRYATEEEIKSWEAAGYGVGIVTGAISKLVVIDQDSQEGGDFLRQFNLRGPKVKTLKEAGWHYYCRYPTTGISNSVKKFPGMDIRGEGGYVVAPPTIINGKQYSWVGGMNRPLMPLPDVFLGASSVNCVAGNKTSAPTISEGLIPCGARHSFLLEIAGAIRRRGLGEEAIYQAVKAAYDEKCEKKASDSYEDIRNRYARSVMKYEPAPYSLPAPEQALSSLSVFMAQEEKVEWLVPSLIARGAIGFVAGLPETCKSWLCMDLAIAVASGQDWAGLFTTKRAKVLFIDQERFAGETRRRFRAILNARGLSIADVEGYLTVQAGSSRKIDIDASYEALQRDLKDLAPDLVIIDSFATFHTKEENNRSDIQVVLERTKELRSKYGCSIIYIDHEGKGAHQDQKEGDEVPHLVRMAGSIAKPASAELVLTVRKKAPGMAGVYVTKSTLAKASNPFVVTVEDLDASQSKIAVRGRNL